MNSMGFDEDARWLLSDGSIIGRVHRKPDPQGVRLTLDMPAGEPVVAVLAKLDAGSMSQFCELARGEYNERKAEQAAAEERGSRRVEESREGGDDRREGSVQGVQTSVVFDPMDPERVTSRMVDIGQRIEELRVELRALEKEGLMLCKIAEMLNDASKDDEETNGSLQTATPSPNEGEGAVSTVDLQPCEDQLLQNGENCAVETNQGLELTSPDSDAEGSSVDHNN